MGLHFSSPEMKPKSDHEDQKSDLMGHKRTGRTGTFFPSFLLHHMYTVYKDKKGQCTTRMKL